MTDTREAGRIILENLGMFNEAAILYEESIQPEIFKEIEELVKDWADEQGWKHVADWEDLNIWVAPVEWNASGNNEDAPSKAWFYLGWEDSDSNSYHLADICGTGQTAMGFWFLVNHPTFVRKTWNSFLKSIPAISRNISEIGFVDKGKSKEGVYFLPVTLSHQELATAWVNEDYAACFKPIEDALATLKEAQGIFDELLAKAEAYAKENQSPT